MIQYKSVKFLNNKYLLSISSKIIIVFNSLVATIIISRFLGPSYKGELAYINNITSILIIILSIGAEQSYGYFVRKNDRSAINQVKKIIVIQNIIYLFVSIIINLLMRNIIIFYITLIYSLGLFAAQLSYIMIIENINIRNFVLILSSFVYTILIIIVSLLLSKNIFYIIIPLLIKNIIEIVYYTKIINLSSVLRLKVTRAVLSRTLKLGLPAMILSLLVVFNYKFDIILLKYYVSFESLGLYSTAVGISNYAWLITDSIKDVLFSKTSKSDSINSIILAIKINIYISVFILIVFFFFGKFFISTLYGQDYLNSYTASTILLIGTIPMIFFKLINTLYVNKGMQNKSVITLAFAVMINIILNIILIPILSINGAAIASVVSYLICGTIFIISFTRSYNIKYKDYLVFSRDEISLLIKTFRRR